MKFLLADLQESIAWGEHWLEKGFYHIKTGKWQREGKQDFRDIIFKYQGQYYTYVQCKQDEKYVNIYDVDDEGFVKCEEYEKGI